LNVVKDSSQLASYLAPPPVVVVHILSINFDPLRTQLVL